LRQHGAKASAAKNTGGLEGEGGVEAKLGRPGELARKDGYCPTGQAIMGKIGKGLMSKKEQFLAFVLVGALAQEFGRKSGDASLIMHIASQIPEERIPENAMNAAKVFLAFCNGVCKKPHNWMLARS
jgi:hypothetical protein